MARSESNRNGRLEEALATLIQNQASFLARVSEMDWVSAERFAQIEARLTRIEAILLQHARLLEALPEAVRENIDFKPTASQS